MLILLRECEVKIEELFGWNVLPLFTKPLFEFYTFWKK